jgi:PIN domain nuclease of toxin-antitoxin system
MRHALFVSTLPNHHRDPFDRILVAQAQLEEMSILSADLQMSRYQVELIW